MDKLLNQSDKNKVNDAIKKFEAATGAELLFVITNSSDPYPAAILRFGIITSFLSTFFFSLFFDFYQSYYWPLLSFSTFILFTLMGRFSWAKKMALSKWEIDRETKEKAVEYFHTLGTSKVSHKVTVMIMVSLLERRIQILVDEKLKEHLKESDRNELIQLMSTYFKSNDHFSGITKAIDLLESKILEKFKGKVSEHHQSEISNSVYFITH